MAGDLVEPLADGNRSKLSQKTERGLGNQSGISPGGASFLRKRIVGLALFWAVLFGCFWTMYSWYLTEAHAASTQPARYVDQWEGNWLFRDYNPLAARIESAIEEALQQSGLSSVRRSVDEPRDEAGPRPRQRLRWVYREFDIAVDPSKVDAERFLDDLRGALERAASTAGATGLLHEASSDASSGDTEWAFGISEGWGLRRADIVTTRVRVWLSSELPPLVQESDGNFPKGQSEGGKGGAKDATSGVTGASGKAGGGGKQGKVAAPTPSGPPTRRPGTPPDPVRPVELPGAPFLAIVIDDWGYDWAAADDMLALPEPITVAVIPFLPRSISHAIRAKERGHEVILHLPMEPLDPSLDPHHLTIGSALGDAEVAERVEKAIGAVPGIVGVNNHMGSKGTADPRVVRTVLEVVKRHGLFFVDSRTSNRSVVPAMAKAVGIPFGVNSTFLDNRDDVAYVKQQLELAAKRAKERGAAIAIGHVRKATARAIRELLPALEKQGIRLVRLSQVIDGLVGVSNEVGRRGGSE